MRRVSCLLALPFLAGAFLVLLRDLTHPPEREGASLRLLGELWYDFHAASLNLVQAVVERYLWEPLWDPGLVWLLLQPAAVALAATGGALLLLCLVRRLLAAIR